MDISWMEYLVMEIDGAGRITGSNGGSLDVGIEKCVVGVVVDFGQLGSVGAGHVGDLRVNLQDAVERKLEITGGKVVLGWNLKKMERESETDYLVLFGGFDGVEEGKEWGQMVERELGNWELVKAVMVVYMRRAEY